MERMMERKFSGHVCASICPNLRVLLVFLWWSLPGSQREVETMCHCYSLWRRTQKATMLGIAVRSLATPQCSVGRPSFWCVALIEKKAEVLLTAALSHAWIVGYIFSYTVCGSMKVITWDRGFCSRPQSTRSVSDGPGTSETTKSLIALLSQLWRDNNRQKTPKQWRMSPITASSRIIRNIQPHVTQSVNITNETLQLFCLSGTKQSGIKQLQTKVSTQLAILSSHKVLLQRPTSTFTGSGNGPRGTQCLFKKTTQSCFFMEPSEKVERKNMI